jgi:bacterioferritin-associated ferredoxin
VESGVRPQRAVAGTDGAIAALEWRDAQGRQRRSPCDSLAVGFGLRSETQLADLCGAPFVFAKSERQWLPQQDRDGRSGVEGLYLAGDGAGIGGAAAAELGGERAALALLHDLGYPGCAQRLEFLNRRLARGERFRRALEQAFPFPADLARAAADDLMICRCEGVTAGDIRDAAQASGAREINRAKALTRLGMGRCQGRVCAPAAVEILADAAKAPVENVGRLRGQAPVKPVPLAAFLDGAAP